MLWTENNLSISSGKRTREQAAKPWGAEEMKSSHHLSQTLLPCLVLLATCNSRFQVTGMIEWRQKSKPQKIPRASNKRKKIPGPKFNLPKIPRRISEPLKFPEELHSQDTRGSDAGTITNVQIVLKDCFERSDCSKKSLLKSTYPKKYMPKFLDPKKTRNWKFHTHKNPSIIPVTWNLEYPPPLRMVVHFILGLQNKVVVNSYTIQTKEDITAFPWYFQKTTNDWSLTFFALKQANQCL